MKIKKFNGLQTFYIIWAGQLVSLIGSGLTGFALGVWVYEQTGSATNFALIYLFTELPGILVSPFAGVIVDRVDRRILMIASDAFAGLGTLGVAVLAASGNLAIWHVYFLVTIISIGSAFQIPAYLASIPLLVPKESLGKVNGLMQTAQAARQVVAPALAGVIYGLASLQAIISIDVTTFLIGVFTLLIVVIPKPEANPDAEQPSFREQASFGWKYIKSRPGMLAILVEIAFFAFVLSIIGVLITPMILAFTTPAILGILTSIGGVGMLVGGFVMSATGGPKRRIHGVLGFLILAGFVLMLHGLQPSVLLIGIVAPCFFFTIPYIFGSNEVIWQMKTPAEVQGRVFATREMLIRSMTPLGYFIAGPLADNIFEPMFVEGGLLSDSVGRFIGVGEGRGIAFMFILGGLLIMIVAALGYLYPRLRFVEDEIPDAILDTPIPETPLDVQSVGVGE